MNNLLRLIEFRLWLHYWVARWFQVSDPEYFKPITSRRYELVAHDGGKQVFRC